MKLKDDKYYTPIDLANYCINKVCHIIGIDNISEVIEPSIGDGSFTHNENLHIDIGYDIDPYIKDKNIRIYKEDYLLNKLSYLKNRLIIGNPPFGDRLSLAQKFYKKSI